ncbi:MAG: NAD(P)-dependent oxidoreductase [Flavobacteriaceae bacterium]
MKVLHIDSNHEVLAQGLEALGCTNDFDYTSSKAEIMQIIDQYEGLVLRSRFSIDKEFLDRATKLKFIGRVGAGLENIYIDYAQAKGILPIAAPEGNRDAVGEHSLSLVLNLFNRINLADREVRQGLWRREGNRGVELDGKTVGIIGYGNMGKNFCKRLRGFDCEVLFYDIREHITDGHACQVSLEELQEKSDVISLHTPQTPLTIGMINEEFIGNCAKPFYLINTARGSAVQTKALVQGLKSGKILGAGLDVLEFEKSSFENFFQDTSLPEEFQYLIDSEKVILSPHVAGWTQESKVKLAQTIVDKVGHAFFGKEYKSSLKKPGVTGIGGVFFKTTDVEKTKKWYAEHLQFNTDAYGSTFWWRDEQANKASTQWSLFKESSNYFEPSEKEFMFNYRVGNLEATLKHLESKGVMPLAETQEFNYGKFNWIMDCDGNKIELWEANDLAFL